MRTEERYTPRSIRFLELWEARGWRLKVYGIAYRGDRPSAELVAAAKEVATRLLPAPPVTEGRYGVGFMGVHQGRGSNLVFLDWWESENELHHHVCTSSPSDPGVMVHANPPGLAACVWDLAVIAFERQAWVLSVLAAAAPDFDQYLATHFDASI